MKRGNEWCDVVSDLEKERDELRDRLDEAQKAYGVVDKILMAEPCHWHLTELAHAIVEIGAKLNFQFVQRETHHG